MGPTVDRVMCLLKLSTLGKLIALSWMHWKSPVLDHVQAHVSLNYSFTAVDGQDFRFTRAHLSDPATPKLCCGSSPTVPSLGSLGACLPRDTRHTPGSATQCAHKPGGAPAAGKKCPDSTRSLNRGQLGRQPWGQTHTTLLEASSSFCELKKNTRKQLTFFNVNVSCLLPTVVSDTLNVPFFTSSFNRSSRVLLQEI